jgi:diacylglycerol kinase family enzyme
MTVTSGGPESRPSTPKDQRPMTTREDGRLDPARKRVVVLANPRAGAGCSRAHVDELLAGLRERRLEPQVCWDRQEFSDAVRHEAGGGLRCVVAAGGDGTLVETLNRAPGQPVALLPVGTENLVARFLKIDRSGEKLAQIIAAGAYRRLDLGRAEVGAGVSRVFCLMAGAGFDADVVHRLHRRRHGHIDKASYVWPIIQALRRYPYPLMDVEDLDSGERWRGAQVFVFNLPQYAVGLPLAPEARGNDGRLNLCVFERPGIANLFRYVTSVLRGRRDKIRDFHHRFIRRVRLSAAQPVRLQTDGDPAGSLPVTIDVIPAALTLLVAAE